MCACAWSFSQPAPWHGHVIKCIGIFLGYCTCAGKAKILDTVREVVGLHHERYVFPAKIAVTKVSGTGVDSMFMGVIKVSPPGP